MGRVITWMGVAYRIVQYDLRLSPQQLMLSMLCLWVCRLSHTRSDVLQYACARQTD